MLFLHIGSSFWEGVPTPVNHCQLDPPLISQAQCKWLHSVLQENKRLYLQLLDLEITLPETNEDKVEEVFELVKNSSLSEEIKEGFSQRRLEFLEDFSSNIVKISKAQEAHNKLYKSKTSQASGKKRSTEEGWVYCCFELASCQEIVSR